MKAALLVCPNWDIQLPTHAPALLQGALKERGHEARAFDMSAEMFSKYGDHSFRALPSFHLAWIHPEYVDRDIIPRFADFMDEYADRVLAYSPRVVGFSTFLSNKFFSLRMAERIKKKDPSVKIVFGGPTCFSERESRDIISRDCVDAVVFGEGDRTFPRLIDGLARTGKLEPGLGIWLREDPSTWTPEQDYIEDLDTLPFPEFEGYDLELYKGSKTLHSSRGCIRRCVFCSDWRLKKKYRQMTGERIFEQLKRQLDADPSHRTFHFADSTMNGKMPSITAFCDKLLETSTTAFWGSFAVVRKEMSPEFLGRMWEAGCRFMLYGIESGSKEMLRQMNKPVVPELNGRVLVDSMQAGIQSTVSIMVGFPTETEEHFRETLDFIDRYAEGIGRLTPSLFSIFEMSDRWADYNLPRENHQLYWRTRDGSNTFLTRLERLGRLFDRAAECSVPVLFEGRISVEETRGHMENLEREYREWASRHAAG